MNKFKIVDENNVERDASVVAVVENSGNQYVIYSIDRDEENANIFVSKLDKDSEGKNIIVDINDADEKSKISEIVNGIVNLPLVGDE